VLEDSGNAAILIEDHFKEIAGFVALAIEAAAVFVVSFGAIQALGAVVKLSFARTADFAGARIALAADIVRTAVAPTWEDITKLAVIATIRTMLNYFLAKDIASFEKGGE
jgi:uncharacterized membrane protein